MQANALNLDDEAGAGQMLAEAGNLVGAGFYDDAASLAESCLLIEPGNTDAHRIRGFARLNLGQPLLAYNDYKIAAAAYGEDRDVWVEFARCLLTIRQYEAARIAVERALSIGPPTFALHMLEGQVHHALRHADAAIAAFDSALVMQPNDLDALKLRAGEFQMKGDFATAKAEYLRILKLDPEHVEAHFLLAHMGEVAGHEDEVVAGLDALAGSLDASDDHKARALFAAGRICGQLDRYEEAFEFYARGNAKLRETCAFDRAEFATLVDDIISHFTADALAALRGAGSDSEAPVFIVGMPRSGSTLTEQILSSHSQVGSAGEFHKLHQIVTALRSETRSVGRGYPQSLPGMPPDLLQSLAGGYLEAIRAESRSDAARVTDKLLFNFLHLGLAAILFPNASFIHCRRDPRDIAVSCYFQNFSAKEQMAFTQDLGDIGFVIGQYRRLMAHWHVVLPGRILDVDYEALVANQETHSRAMVAHCGLAWEDACLRPHENTREVKTASFWQVRQPVYSSSAGAWRKYRSRLAPLFDELGDACAKA